MCSLLDSEQILPFSGKDGMLVVIDMQPRYKTSRGCKLQKAVRDEILAAKSRHWWTLILEFGGENPHRPTYPGLMQLLTGYYRCIGPVIKLKADGSREIKESCLKRLLQPKKIRVCGVNIGACVHATVDGLIAEYPDTVIEVVRKACNDVDPHEKWQYFMKHPRVSIV